VNRIALLQVDIEEMEDVLRASAPLEEGCFMLLREGRGTRGRRLMALDPILLPPTGGSRGNATNFDRARAGSSR
jgi:hypothetical protein